MTRGRFRVELTDELLASLRYVKGEQPPYYYDTVQPFLAVAPTAKDGVVWYERQRGSNQLVRIGYYPTMTLASARRTVTPTSTPYTPPTPRTPTAREKAPAAKTSTTVNGGTSTYESRWAKDAARANDRFLTTLRQVHPERLARA